MAKFDSLNAASDRLSPTRFVSRARTSRSAVPSLRSVENTSRGRSSPLSK